MVARTSMPRPPRPSLIELEQRKPSKDPRVTHRGRYSAWLWKVKSNNAVMKWVKESSSRFFTIDFDQQIFYYSHSEGSMNMSHLVSFKSILGAEQHPPSFGFSVETRDRTYMLYSTSNADAALWVAAVRAARELGKLEARKLEKTAGASLLTARGEQKARRAADALLEAGVNSIMEAAHNEKKFDDGKPPEEEEPHTTKDEEPYTTEEEDPSCNFEHISDVSTFDMLVKSARASTRNSEDWDENPRSDRSDSSDCCDSTEGHAQQQATKATVPATSDSTRRVQLHFDMCTAHTVMIKIITERLAQRFGCFAFFLNYVCFNGMVPCQYA